MNAWIPASHRPEERIRVLVVTDDRLVLTAFYGLGSTLARDPHRRCWRSDDRSEHPLGNLDGDALWTVVGWMPLPPAYPLTQGEIELRRQLGIEAEKESIPLLEHGDPRITEILGKPLPKPRPTVTRDGVTVEAGQVWESMDHRDSGRRVTATASPWSRSTRSARTPRTT